MPAESRRIVQASVGKPGEIFGTSFEFAYKSADGNRVQIPAEFCEASALEVESTEILLWMPEAGRYRLIPMSHSDDPEIATLQNRITERQGATSATSFDSAARTVLGTRLVKAVLSCGKERRLSLPPTVMELLKVREAKEVVIVRDGKFIEVWSVRAFDASFSAATSELL